MPFEHFKTQVLLLHSQQGTLDNLSAGFNDNYSVHCATTGSEALSTLGETPIHVIVTAQDLPGMSGLEALREARKRSPETIGILLAGADKSDGLEALVGAKEVFRIVREKVTPESLLHLVESATQQARLLALAESANDNSANPDMPVTEEIVMETLENGALIISDGTNRLPALKPQKIQLAPVTGTRDVDLLVMTRDDEFLATIGDSARGLHHLHHAVTSAEAEKFVRDKRVGVLIIDSAMADSEIESLTAQLRKAKARLVTIVAGRRDDGEMLMDLINRGHVYRFLLKPVSPGRARLAIEASVKHHIEAPDSAFKPKAPGKAPTSLLAKPALKPKPNPVIRNAAVPTPKAKPKPVTDDASIPVLVPQGKARPKISPRAAVKAAAKPAATPVAKPPARPAATKAAKPAPQPRLPTQDSLPKKIEPTISAAPVTVALYEAGNAKRRIRATMSGFADSVDRTLTSAGALASGAQGAMVASGEAVAVAVGSALQPLRKRGLLRIGGTIAACALAVWIYSNRETLLPAVLKQDTESVAEVAPAATKPVATTAAPQTGMEPPGQVSAANAGAQPSPYEALLAEARAAAEAGNYTRPQGFSAFDLYRELQRIAPRDPVVAAELEIVIDRVLRLAEAAIIERNIADARATLARVRLVDPGNQRLAFLDAQLTQAEIRTLLDEARVAMRDGRFDNATRLIDEARIVAGRQTEDIDLVTQQLAAARVRLKVDETLELAGAHLQAGNLVAPSNDNARYYYELALANDPGNKAAQQGLKIVAGKLALGAREAIDLGRLEDASRLLAEARAIDPASRELAASSAAFRAAVDAKVEAELQAEAQRLADIERQAELARQAEAARLAEQERQAELARRAEAERQAELSRQAELQRQAEEARLAEVERQQAAAREAEIQRQQQEAQLAKAREEQKRNAEQVASATATAAALGVAGSKVKDPAASPASRPAAQRSVPDQAAQRTTSVAPPPAAEAAPAELPTATLPLTAAAQSSAGNGTSGAAADGTVPISALTRTNYVAPEFPRAAQRRNLSGAVDLAFTVTTIGTVKDVRVISAEPEGIFDAAAVDAVSQWRFDPVIENGVALEKNSAVRLSFALDQ